MWKIQIGLAAVSSHGTDETTHSLPRRARRLAGDPRMLFSCYDGFAARNHDLRQYGRGRTLFLLWRRKFYVPSIGPTPKLDVLPFPD